MIEPSEYKLRAVKVKNIREIALGIFMFSYERVYAFTAGQVVAITVDLADEPKLYSIASGENEAEISILFNVIPSGKLSTKLANLSKGDKIYVSQPFGEFKGDKEYAYWIAAGTGIAPFISMYYSGLGKNKVLIHGGRTRQSFYFQDVFKKALGKNYIRCCSGEKGENIFSGRLTDFLKTEDNLPLNFKYYLCGSSEMVVETRDILIAKGIPFNQIIAEIYF